MWLGGRGKPRPYHEGGVQAPCGERDVEPLVREERSETLVHTRHPPKASPTRAATARLRSAERGFSFIELMVVIGIMLLAIGIVTPALQGMSPRYSLEAAAKGVAASIELQRGTAVGQGKLMGLVYDLDAGAYRLFSPDPENPNRLAPVGRWRELGRHVRFRGVQPQGLRYQQGGSLRVRFDPSGVGGSHIVHLENTKGEVMSVKFNAFIGHASVGRGEAEFEEARP